DVEAWLQGQQVRATGSVQTSRALAPSNQRLERFVPSVNSILARSRDWVRERIQEALQGRPYAGVVVALVIGEQREISAGDWKIFNRTGVGHLMSISGLHITMVASLFALSA